MTFKKNQYVTTVDDTIEFRVESGPWNAGFNEVRYLVQVVSDRHCGHYRFYPERELKPMPPRVGDVGRYDAGSHTLRVIREINDEYVVLQRVEEDTVYTRYRTVARELFDRNWEAET